MRNTIERVKKATKIKVKSWPIARDGCLRMFDDTSSFHKTGSFNQSEKKDRRSPPLFGL
jgi:hypothetical protein